MINNASAAPASRDFNAIFGNKKPAAVGSSDRAKAQFWVNIGYVSDTVDSEGKHRFVSLPLGIPLDTQERLATNSRNTEFAEFQASRNDLLDQLMAAAEPLAPGEDRIIAFGDSGLSLQIRRVNDELADVAPESNRFGKKLALV